MNRPLFSGGGPIITEDLWPLFPGLGWPFHPGPNTDETERKSKGMIPGFVFYAYYPIHFVILVMFENVLP